MWGCCFRGLHYLLSVVKGSVSSAPSCWAVLTHGHSPDNEKASKLLRHLIFARHVDEWHSRDSIEPDLASRQNLNCPLTYCVWSGVFFFFFFFFSCVCIKPRSIVEDINAILAFFLLPLLPPQLKKWEFCLTLIGCIELGKMLIRKWKGGGSSSVCNIISALPCECLGNKQSVGGGSVQRWI